MTGRPSKLAPERVAIVLEAIEAGNFLATAAAVAGVDYSTLKRWMRRGRSEARKDADFRALRVAVLRARAAAEAGAVATVQKSRSWQAAAWFLERSHRDRWGPVSRVKAEVTGKDGGPIVHRPDLSGLTDAELAALAALADKVAPGRPGGAGAGDRGGDVP